MCLIVRSIAAVGQGKGVGVWYFPPVEASLADVNVEWYYTWRPDNTWEPAPEGVEFVPMLWDKEDVTDDTISEMTSHPCPYLLGFNEPDHSDQADMSVEQALDLWPRLMETGKLLGSPASAGNAGKEGSWTDEFMTGATERGYQVDFICVHWYGSGTDPATETRHLKDHLQTVYDRYEKPLWLTEFALVDWGSSTPFPPAETQAAFIDTAIPMLESLSFVHRYAWFSLPPWNYGSHEGTTHLYENDGTITAPGIAWRDGGGTPDISNQLPSVTLTAPEDSITIPAGSDITLQADASDPDGNVAAVVFFTSDSLLGIDQSRPYSLRWKNVHEGIYACAAAAIDNDGDTGVSDTIRIAVEKTTAALKRHPDTTPRLRTASGSLALFLRGATGVRVYTVDGRLLIPVRKESVEQLRIPEAGHIPIILHVQKEFGPALRFVIP
jgi:hypothetical protein